VVDAPAPDGPRVHAQGAKLGADTTGIDGLGPEPLANHGSGGTVTGVGVGHRDQLHGRTAGQHGAIEVYALHGHAGSFQGDAVTRRQQHRLQGQAAQGAVLHASEGQHDRQRMEADGQSSAQRNLQPTDRRMERAAPAVMWRTGSSEEPALPVQLEG